MASSARRDPVRELALLVRGSRTGLEQPGRVPGRQRQRARPGARPRPSASSRRARLDDEELAPRIRRLLGRAGTATSSRTSSGVVSGRSRRPSAWGHRATWTDLGAELDVDLLLGELLADRTKKWVSFTTDQGVRDHHPEAPARGHRPAAAHPHRPRGVRRPRGPALPVAGRPRRLQLALARGHPSLADTC